MITKENTIINDILNKKYFIIDDYNNFFNYIITNNKSIENDNNFNIVENNLFKNFTTLIYKEQLIIYYC